MINKLNSTFIFSACLTLLISGCAIKPVQFTQAEHNEKASQDIQNLFKEQEAITQAISLHEAMARAIKYNLDHRVQLMEEALRRGQLSSTTAQLLPQLTVSAGYTDRSNVAGSSSQSITTGTESLETSQSTDLQLRTRNAELVWNILDFGISYAQAKQQADEVLISEEKRRRVVQNIMQDVRFAYWRALSAQQLLPNMDELLIKINVALKKVEKIDTLKINQSLDNLNYRKSLLGLSQQMWQIRETLKSAVTEFSSLINLRPGTEYKLTTELETPSLDIDTNTLESYALTHRPEIHEEQYRSRISELEIDKAIARMLPGIEIRVGKSYDSNSFTLNNQWSNLGLRLTWNIFNLFTGQQNIDNARANLSLDNARRLSLNIAVMTQVNLAVLRFHIAKQRYTLSNELSEIEAAIQHQAKAKRSANSSNDLEVLQTNVTSLVAKMNAGVDFAQLQNAYGRIHHSIGFDPISNVIGDTDIASMSDTIKQQLNTWSDVFSK